MPFTGRSQELDATLRGNNVDFPSVVGGAPGLTGAPVTRSMGGRSAQGSDDRKHWNGFGVIVAARTCNPGDQRRGGAGCRLWRSLWPEAASAASAANRQNDVIKTFSVWPHEKICSSTRAKTHQGFEELSCN
jgi:hypothetical protein